MYCRSAKETTARVQAARRLIATCRLAVLGLIVLAAFHVSSARAGEIAFVTGEQYSSQGGNPDIWVMNDDGTGMVPFIEHPAMDVSPTYSPAGDRLAFLSNRSGSWAIYVVNSDGTGLHMVPNSEFNAPEIGEEWSRLSWSPDGGKFVYQVTDEVGGMGTINADGTGKTVFTTDGVGDGVYTKVRGMSWGPTMDEIMVHVEDYSWHQNIFKYTISGDGWTQMTFDETPSHVLQPAVNSDGQIVFSRRASWDQLYDLYVMENEPGGPSVNVTNFSVPQGAFNPDWMNGSSGFTFSYNEGPGSDSQVGVINGDGTGFELFEPPPGMLYAIDPTWVPEPATWFLVAVGGLATMRRRRQ